MEIILIIFIIGIPMPYLLIKKKAFSPGFYITILYLGSFFSSLFIDHFSEWHSIEATVFLGLTLLLFFIPLIIHSTYCNKNIAIGNARMLIPFAKLLIFFGAISIIKFIIEAKNILDNILTPTAFRSQKIQGFIVSDSGFFEYIALIGSNLYYLFLAMFFIIIITNPKKKFLQACLFISSLAYPMTTLRAPP